LLIGTPYSTSQVFEVYGPPFGGSPPLGIDVLGNGTGMYVGLCRWTGRIAAVFMAESQTGGGNRLTLSRDKSHNFDHPWVASTDIAPNSWQDVVVHVKFSANPSVGFVELWHQGVPQQFQTCAESGNAPSATSGPCTLQSSTRLYYATLVPGNNCTDDGTVCTNTIYLDQYRNGGPENGVPFIPLGNVTIFHGPATVAKTYAAAVAPVV
jgi:hypothetical protein